MLEFQQVRVNNSGHGDVATSAGQQRHLAEVIAHSQVIDKSLLAVALGYSDHHAPAGHDE